MARNLESLLDQYGRTSSDTAGSRRVAPLQNRGPSSRQVSEKPRDTLKTVLRLIRYLSGHHLMIGLSFLAMLLSSAASLLSSYVLFPIINRIADLPTTVENSGVLAAKTDGLLEDFSGILSFTGNPTWVNYLITSLGILIFIYLVGVLASYFQRKLLLQVSQSAVARMRSDLFAHLQQLPVRYFDRHTTGELMGLFTNDLDSVGTMLDTSLIEIFSGIILLAGTLVFMISTNWLLTMVCVLVIPLILKTGQVLARLSRRNYRRQQAVLGAINGYIEETVSGQKEVQVFCHEETSLEEFLLLNNDLRQKQFLSQFTSCAMGPVIGCLGQISFAITMGLGGLLMCLRGLTPGAMTVFAQYSKKFSMPIENISQQITTVLSALAGAERVFAALDQQPEEADIPEALAPVIRGDVEFSHVSFGYTPEKIVLRDLSLSVKQGQTVAFVGSTGAGKTTITNLLGRIYDIEQGSITLDGRPLKSYARSYLRKNVAMVLQDTHLFTGTVMENIRYGNPAATDAQVREAARVACADSFISRLKNGYDTVIEGDGRNLSQGQRQLLNIARAAVSPAPLLVLDEATSSVDTRTEYQIEKGMARLMRSRTTFVVAHRLSTVRHADCIYVLEDGQIMESGTHEELLALKGRYYELFTGVRELA